MSSSHIVNLGTMASLPKEVSAGVANNWRLFLEFFDGFINSKRLPRKRELEDPSKDVRAILEYASDQPNTDQYSDQSMKDFVDHLYQHVITAKSTWAYWILFVIAESTRQLPEWRDMLGEKQRTVQDTPLRQLPNSVLGVAQCLIVEDQTLNRELNPSLKEALRIIGNCCADNDINRSLLLYSGGINALLKLIEQRIEVSTVIAVLYNICSDYNEPALDDKGQVYSPPNTSEQDLASGAHVPITLAEKYLAQWQNNHPQHTTIELFLTCQEQCDEMYFPYLTELLKMCAALASVDLSATLNPSNEISAINQIDNLLESLSTFGERIIERSQDTVNDLCDVVRLLLQNAEIEKQLLEKDIKYINQFLLQWLYKVELEDEEGLQRQSDNQKAGLQLLYRLADKPVYIQMISSAPQALQQFITDVDDYVNSVLLNLPNTAWIYPITYTASVLVLLCNAAKSPILATDMCTTYSLTSPLITLLSKTTQTILLTPAIRLATRLAQTEGAHEALYDADIFPAIHALLTHPPGIPPAILDEGVHLLRLYLTDPEKRAHAQEMMQTGLLTDLQRIASSNAPYLDSSGLRRQIAAVLLELAKIVEESSRPGSQDRVEVPLSALVDLGVALAVDGDGNVRAVVLAAWVLLALEHSGGKREVVRGLGEEGMGKVVKDIVEQKAEVEHEGARRNLEALWQLVKEEEEFLAELIEVMKRL